MTCPDCGETFVAVTGTRYYAMISHMVNKGEITVGEARAELANPLTDDNTAAFLAGWVMDRADQGDDWKAGMPVRLPNGAVVDYDDEHNWAPVPGTTVWARRNVADDRYLGSGAIFPAGSYNSGL